MKRILIFLVLLLSIPTIQKTAGAGAPPPIPSWVDPHVIQFIQAARSGNFATIQKMFAQDKALINQWDTNKTTALIEAVKSNRLDIVTWLLKHGATIEHKDKAGKTAEDYAEGKPAILGVLLEAQGIMPPPPPAPKKEAVEGAGARPASPKKPRSTTPVKAQPAIPPKVKPAAKPKVTASAAAKPGESEEQTRARIIAEMQASKLIPLYGDDKDKVLIAAIRSKNLPYVKYAVETMKADPASIGDDRWGRTPIYWAAKEGNLTIVDYLLKTNKWVAHSIGLTNRENGFSALSYAAYSGNKEMVKKFLEYYKDKPEKLNEDIQTAKSSQRKAGAALEKMVAELSTAGAGNISPEQELPRAEEGAGAAVAITPSPVKQTAAPKPVTPAKTITPSAHEPKLSDAEAQKIIAQKRGTSIWDKNEDYLLAQGIKEKKLPWIQYAVEKMNAKVNKQDRGQLSHLYRAATTTPAIVRYLLSKGADVNAVLMFEEGNPGNPTDLTTPLDKAVKVGRKDIVQTFLEFPLSRERIERAMWFANKYNQQEIKTMLQQKLNELGS